MKKILIILASIILLFSCIKKRSGDKKITLTFATPTDAITYKNWIKPVIDDFEENHPGVKIKVILTSGGHVSKLQSMIAAGTPPDVFDIWGPEMIPALAERDALLDIGPLANEDKEFKSKIMPDIYANVLEGFYYKGKLYSLPRGFGINVIFYNKDLFDKEGIAYPSEKWGLTDFLTAAKRLTKDLDGDGRIDQYGYSMRGGVSAWGNFMPYVWANGGDLFNKDRTRCTITDPKVVEALQWFIDLVNKHEVAPKTSWAKDMAFEAPFTMGKVAMWYVGIYPMKLLKNVKNINWDVAPLPRGKKKRAMLLYAGGTVASAKTKYPKECWEFIKWIGGPVGQKMICNVGADIPTLKSMAYDEFLKIFYA